jgi:CIC family chloride channel protein
MTLTLPRTQQLRLRENQLFLVLTILVGVLAGLAAVLFTVAIDQTGDRLFGLAPSQARLWLIPPAISIVTGVLLAKVFPEVRGSGVPQTKASYHLSKGQIPARVPLGKFITGILCIGSGHSMGREGPSVQIGAGLASVIGRWVGLPVARVRDLVPVGAAGALAAAFNTPVAAVLFALEEIIGDMNAALLGSTVVASVASVVVERSILGNEPLFHVPAYELVHPAELGAYAVLGVAGGLVSVAFCKGLLAGRALFRRLPASTTIWQPAIGGIVIGAIIARVPQVMGVGYQYIDQALNGGLLLQTMVVLCFVKLAATVVSYSSGNAGGIFAPSLYIGAMAGGAVGAIVHAVAPFPTANAGAYALVGMGALFAGIIRAPMTSVFMIFEITQDYQILVPLMVANMLSFTISRRLQAAPVYHALLHQDGVHLPAAPSPPTMRTAGEIMRSVPTFLHPDVSADTALQTLLAQNAPAALIGSDGRWLGTVDRDDLASRVAAGETAIPIGSLLDGEELVHVHPDHPLDVVIDRFPQTAGLLPVVSRADARRLVGVIALADILPRTGDTARRPSTETGQDPSRGGRFPI